MDATQIRTAKEYLSHLGLTPDEAGIFLTLSQQGPLTILSLARKTGINRTKIYRMIDSLGKKSITQEVIDEHRILIQAVDTQTLELLIKEHEARSRYLREVFPSISEMIRGRKSVSQPGTKVLFYRGMEGVRSQVWNTLKTKGELLGYSYRPVSELIGKYYEQWYKEWIKRGLKMRDIYSDTYIEGKKSVKQTTDSLSFKSGNIISRYIPSETLNITHQTDLYNDIVSIYHWYEGEVFGVEIYNETVAQMQKQIFEIIWSLAQNKSGS